MGKSKPTAGLFLSCDTCDFTSTSSYMFKRHVHQCLTLHGLAAKGSSPRNPIRLKGADSPSKPSPVQSLDSNTEGGAGSEEGDPEGVISDELAQQNIDVSPSIGSKDEGDSVEHPDETNLQNDDNPEEQESSQKSNVSGTGNVPSPYSRRYKCTDCSFSCLSSSEFLYHNRDNHGHVSPIFECQLCDYASKFEKSVSRHMSVHKSAASEFSNVLSDIKKETQPLSNDSLSSVPHVEKEKTGFKLRVKPLKLKRLKKKASFFKVSEKRENYEPSTAKKEVLKLIVSEDGRRFYQCTDCLYFSQQAHNVRKHHNVCHNKMLTCPHCPDFANCGQASLYEHLLTHSERNYVKCPDCSYVTHAKSNYDNHRSFHDNEFAYKCTECSYGNVTESKIKRHMATQHINHTSAVEASEDQGSQNEAMDTAESSVMGEDDLALPEDDLLPDTGGLHIADAVQIQRQQKKRAKQLKQNPDKIEYQCPKCAMSCFRRGNFTKHLIAKHKYTLTTASNFGKNIERQARKNSIKPNGNQKKFSLQTSLSLKCHMCSYIAKWHSDLKRHMQVHSVIKRFKCTLCPNKYKYYGDLNVHVRRDHDGAEPPPQAEMMQEISGFEEGGYVKKASPSAYRCPVCTFVAKCKADLDYHSKSHGDVEKTFQCRMCNYQTYWRGDVTRHLFRQHQVVLSKEALEMNEHFISRSHIRPVKKQEILTTGLPDTNSDDLDVSCMSPTSLTIAAAVAMETATAPLHTTPLAPVEIAPKPRPPQQTAAEILEAAPPPVMGKNNSMTCSYPNCEYRTPVNSKMEEHLAVHLNLKKFMCPHCGKRTNWKWDIVKHMVKVHLDKSATKDDIITLSIEDAKSTIDDYLSYQNDAKKDTSIFLCNICDFRSFDKNRVKRHLSLEHEQGSGNVLSEKVNNAEEYKALVKEERAKNMASDKQNKKIMNESKQATVKQEQIIFEDPPEEELALYESPFACSICNKLGKTKGSIKKHYNYAHPYKEVQVLYRPKGIEFNFESGEVYQIPSAKEFEDSAIKANHSISPDSKLKVLASDSKFSNPKQHGYVKPFKCSICGLRSNWKWDLKKHLRSKHASKGGYVIMLSLEEAQETYGVECSASHPKTEGFLAAPARPSSAGNASMVSSMSEETSPMPDSGDSGDQSLEDAEQEMFNLAEQETSHVEMTTQVWKCSGCSFISRWRRNVQRHMKRKHTKGTTKVIPLEGPPYEGKEAKIRNLGTMDKYMQQGLPTMVKFETSSAPVPTSPQNATLQGDARVWRCEECSFLSSTRSQIIIHMQNHGLKPFKCAVCNSPFMTRWAAHKHIQRVHHRGDYLKLIKTVIKYDKEIETTSINTGDGITPQLEFKSVARPDPLRGGKNCHFCPQCPFRCPKKAVLAFHMTFHRQSSVNRIKCQFCNYWVNTPRLIQQHQKKWHLEMGESGNTDQGSPLRNYNVGVDSPDRQVGVAMGRLRCQKCPYTTNSKNDFIYHKQFHRPKRNAEFKCEFCDYWVVHKRLLKQHLKLHTEGAGSNSDLSPAKSSLYSDPGLVYDPAELTELSAFKQQMITDKISASLSDQPTVSPMKLASRVGGPGGRPGYVMKGGVYRKVHKCRFCPYTNTRTRNMHLHEMMHGPRESPHPLTKCPHCDYYVGSRGLLAQHLRYHEKSYSPYGSPPEREEADDLDDPVQEMGQQQKVDTLLRISRFKKYGCEKCPFASGKRGNFERHLELHGSRQRYTCQFCDYSVPSNNLLAQHTRIHLLPNQNLLLAQSVTNLHHLAQVPADVALASALPPADGGAPVTISVTHDHLAMYENSIMDAEPKKLYRCDRCPYANVRRDYLLAHLKFHMVSSAMVCPYCDYSAPKPALLTQHVRIHFCPLPELSQWLLETGQDELRCPDMTEPMQITDEYQNQVKKKLTVKDEPENINGTDVTKKELSENKKESPAKADGHKDENKVSENVSEKHFVKGVGDKSLGNITGKEETTADKQKDDDENKRESIKTNGEQSENKKDASDSCENKEISDVKDEKMIEPPQTYVCQYCDREFTNSEKLVNHELQHLVGNHFEREEYLARNKYADQASLKAIAEKLKRQNSEELAQQVKDQSTEGPVDYQESSIVKPDITKPSGKPCVVSISKSNSDDSKSNSDDSVESAEATNEVKDSTEVPDINKEQAMDVDDTNINGDAEKLNHSKTIIEDETVSVAKDIISKVKTKASLNGDIDVDSEDKSENRLEPSTASTAEKVINESLSIADLEIDNSKKEVNKDDISELKANISSNTCEPVSEQSTNLDSVEITKQKLQKGTESIDKKVVFSEHDKEASAKLADK